MSGDAPTQPATDGTQVQVPGLMGRLATSLGRS
jgi:hypothetical protein